ncbi:MAG: HflC family protein [Herbaspirillum sp.]|nr:HflC family protein [Herbaspirillum sp.]
MNFFHRHNHSHHAGHAHDGNSADHISHPPSRNFYLRCAAAGIIIVLGALAASLVQVRAGEATVITRLGNPSRVLLQPGVAWRIPAPIEASIPVDLRLHTTSTGLEDVGTRDGLRVIMQAYAAWHVRPDAEHIERFLRAVRNQPDEAALQIQTFIGSALQTTASGFDMTSLVNTDASKVQLDTFEQHLRATVESQLLDAYGVEVSQIGLQRLTLPAAVLAATVDRMRAERQTIAAQRTAEGHRMAAEINSDADRDAHIRLAQAGVEAAGIEAQARADAAKIYGAAYQSNPRLYTTLRSLDTLNTVINANTRIVLRTDAAPFNILVDGPAAAAQTSPAGSASRKGKK